MQFLRVHVDLRRAQRRVAEQCRTTVMGSPRLTSCMAQLCRNAWVAASSRGGAPRALVPAPHVVVESRPREGFPWLLSHTGSSRRDRRRVSRRGWRRTRPASWRLPGRGEQSRTAPPLPVTRTYGSSTSRTRSRIRRPHSSPARIPVRRGELRTRCPARATPSGPSDSGSRRRRGRSPISASRVEQRGGPPVSALEEVHTEGRGVGGSPAWRRHAGSSRGRRRWPRQAGAPSA